MREPIDTAPIGDETETATEKPERVGFLPIVTGWFDRVFIGIYIWVALELFWMRFLEQSIPLVFCHLLALAIGALIVWRG